MGRGRTACALGVALAAHVAVAALLPARMSSARAARSRSLVSDEAAALTLELDEAEALGSLPSASTRVDAPNTRARVPVSALSARRGRDTATDPSRAERVEESGNVAAGAVGAPGDETWTFPTARVELGLGERTGALARANAIGPHRESASAKRDARLLLSLDSIDAAHGRARTGPLREAVDEVARRAEAPMEGVAVFEITVGPNHPARARLLDASSEYGGWSGLTEALDTVARKKTLRFPYPRTGQGLRVVVRVEAAMRLVDGRREKDLGVKTTTTGLAVRENVAAGDSKVVLPSASLHLRGKVCSLSLTAGLTTAPIGGGCSLEVIGTRAARRVRTTLVSEERISLAEERGADADADR